MREILREGGWPIYPVIVLGVIALVSSLRYTRGRSRERLGSVVGFTLATLLMGALGTGLGLQHAAIGTFHGPPEQRHFILAGFYEAMHNLDFALVFALGSTLIATIGGRRKDLAATAVPIDG